MAGHASGQHWALVLAGGDGTRLQELTREITGTPIPKQYCPIFGDRSLLEVTLDRTEYFAPPERTLVVINSDHLAISREQLGALPSENVLVQPCNRDTGPGLTLSLLALAQRDPEATVAVFPSDHYVDNDRAFIAHVIRAACIVAERPKKVVVLGMRPDRPEPAYGYITPARPLRAMTRAAFHVAAFWEKPDSEALAGLHMEGGLWNSFVMVFRLRRMLDLLRRTTPEQFAVMRGVRRLPNTIGDAYRHLIPWNFSSHFLSRIPQHLVVLRVDDVHWSDWGTPESIHRTLARLKQAPPWQPRRVAPAAA